MSVPFPIEAHAPLQPLIAHGIQLVSAEINSLVIHTCITEKRGKPVTEKVSNKNQRVLNIYAMYLTMPLVTSLNKRAAKIEPKS
jgi:hypothetical protein